jgi:biotin operon repressor
MGIIFVKIMAKMFELNITSLYEMAILCLACKYNDTGLFMSNDGLAKDFHASRRSIVYSINRLRKNGYIQYESTGYGKRIIRASSAIVALYNEDNGQKASSLNGANIAPSDSATYAQDGANIAPSDSATYAQNGATCAQDSAIPAPITKVTKRTDSNIKGLLPGIDLQTKPPRKKISLPYPTWDEWLSYCKSIDWDDELDCSSAFNHYVACGWVQGKNKSEIVDWHGAARGCRDRNEKRRRERTSA